MKTAEFKEVTVDGGNWLELEVLTPNKPIHQQLQEFLDSNPGISIVSTALSDHTRGFFVEVRTRTMIVIYHEADPQ